MASQQVGKVGSDFFDSAEAIKLMNRRRLDSKCPLLRGYLSRGQRVLDVGCSGGSMTLDVAQAVNPGRVTGVDVSASAVEEARKQARDLGVDNVDFQIGDTYHLPFGDGTFDSDLQPGAGCVAPRAC